MVQVVEDALSRIRQFLDSIGYDQLQRKLRPAYAVTPYANYAEWKKTTERLPVPIRLAYQILHLGDPIPIDAATSAWGARIVADLIATRMLIADEDGWLRTNGYSLISLHGRYLLSSLNPAYPQATATDNVVYIGPDSYVLARALPQTGRWNNVLELCAGSGLCSMLLAERAGMIVGTEIDSEAVEVARFNAALNGYDQIDMRVGSLYQPVGDAQFDLIVANPPFLPVPHDVAYPLALCGNGGVDGFRVLGQLLTGLAAHLAAHGRALIYAEGFGQQQETTDCVFIAERLREQARRDRLNITLNLIGRMPLKQVMRLKSIALARQGPEALAELPRWYEMYERYNATHSYNFLIDVRRGSGRFMQHAVRPEAQELYFAVGKGRYIAEPTA